ncbi:Putative aliphatic sulfonates-binding protein precursor [Sporomusa ovata DSM 2662]|uniref:ABC-type probable sulfate transporter, periplasmic binding protein n=1 Tax=Sporomusa ovata TaxID=2378 RepID=A0A0U1KTT7_9FIRM|nr:MetQ/NlpA family ABC transporter substrate-binding protein [Sporomusa ovata]EQB26747.1 ABC-type nitrate/sulfonate/bicarbonate transport system, periplasmic component [Sporomusa ovata DSM 2662]CQR70841.1 ABC-type probable sulfate transporter, periplasmic binding protein [Sporomusa ovata]
MRKNIVLITIALLLLVLAGCASEKKENTAPKQGQLQNITIGLMPDVDSIPFIIAQEKGYFKEEGVTVTLKPFKSAMERDSALQSGNLDGAISDVLAEAFAKAGGFDTVITALTNGSYKLVVNKSETASAVQDLKGKNVAISKNTIIEYVTDRIATEGGLTTTDMNKTVIPQIPARLEMLQNDKISAATLPDPLATVAVKNGGRVINTSEQLGINPGVMLFTTKAINEKEQEIQAMYRAYNKAVDYLAREPMDSYIDMVIEKAGFPPDVKGALILPKYKKATAPQQKDIDDVITWMQSRQLIQQKYQYTELVDTRFVRQ